MSEFIHLLTQTETIYVFVSIIIFTFLIPLFQSIFGIINKVNSEIIEAIEIIDVINNGMAYKYFYENFEDINNKIYSIKGLSRVWYKFTESLHFNENNKKIYVLAII